jgi:hypothetical protein
MELAGPTGREFLLPFQGKTLRGWPARELINRRAVPSVPSPSGILFGLRAREYAREFFTPDSDESLGFLGLAATWPAEMGC